MCSFRRLLVALCVSACVLCAKDTPKLSPAQQEVINAHEARTEASNKRDQAAYSRYVADDCIFSTDDGSVRNQSSTDGERGKAPHRI